MFNQILESYKAHNILNNDLSIADDSSIKLVLIDGTIINAEVNKMNNKGIKIITTHINGIVNTKLILNDAKTLVVKLAVIIHSLDLTPVKQDDVIKVMTNKTSTVTISNKTKCDGYFTVITTLNSTNVIHIQHLDNTFKNEIMSIKSMAALLKFIKKNRTCEGELPNYQDQFNNLYK